MTTPMSKMTSPTVVLRELGKVRYREALALQQSLANKYKTAQPPQAVGELVLCEHDPVYTLGLRQKQTDFDKEKVTKLGAEIHKIRRGGLTTFHGPGQLLVYPVLNLRALKLGVRDYVCCLERSVIRGLAEFGVEGFTTQDVGVWVREEGEERKICALGIQVTAGVCYHGLALNCSTDLSWFTHITPCGLVGKRVTSLSHLLGRTVGVAEVSSVIVACLTNTVGFELISH